MRTPTTEEPCLAPLKYQIDLHDLRSDFAGFSQLAGLAARTGDVSFDEVELNFRWVRWFDANMAAPLGALLARLKSRLNDIALTHMPPQIEQVLSKNSFLASYGYRRRPDTYGTTIEYHRFKPTEESFFASYLEEHLVGKGIPRMSEGLNSRFRESILEIFNNSATHSNTGSIFACGQYFPNKDLLDFSMVDLGIGIRERILRAKKLDLRPLDAILWSLDGNNTTRTGTVPGGLGLKLLRDFAAINKGRLQIVSDAGYWEKSSTGLATRTLPRPFPGTVVNLEINTADKHSYCLASELDLDDIF